MMQIPPGAVLPARRTRTLPRGGAAGADRPPAGSGTGDDPRGLPAPDAGQRAGTPGGLGVLRVPHPGFRGRSAAVTDDQPRGVRDLRRRHAAADGSDHRAPAPKGRLVGPARQSADAASASAPVQPPDVRDALDARVLDGRGGPVRGDQPGGVGHLGRARPRRRHGVHHAVPDPRGLLPAAVRAGVDRCGASRGPTRRPAPAHAGVAHGQRRSTDRDRAQPVDRPRAARR